MMNVEGDEEDDSSVEVRSNQNIREGEGFFAFLLQGKCQREIE